MAIENGMNIRKSLDIVEKIRSSGINIPIIMMGYINPILNIGLSNFAKLATNAGANGLIIADMPNEELKQIQISTAENSLDTIPLISLNSSEERIELGCKYAQGFIVLPGGVGTLDELFEAITLIQTKKIGKFPIVLVGKSFWRGLIEWIKQVMLNKEKNISPEDLDLFSVVDTADQALDIINNFYNKYGLKPNF